MSFKNVTYKMPRARKESVFTVYPFTAESEQIKLQSENHCIVVFVSGEMKGQCFVSPRFNQYPRFEACHPRHGGKQQATPEEISKQLDIILKTPTGKVVRLV